MAQNYFDQLISTLQAQPIVRQATNFVAQNPTPLSYVQNLISGYAQQNPNQAGQILANTKPLQQVVNTVRQSPVSYAAPIIQQTASNVGSALSKLISQPQVRAVAPTTLKPLVISPAIPQPTRNTSVPGQQHFTTPVVASQNKPPQPTGQGTAGQPVMNGPQLYSQLLSQAKQQNAPYYEKLLADANWNIDEAKRKMQEDYQNGLRQAQQSADTETRNLFQQTIPQENVSMAENLNKRGLLSTVTGDNAQQPSGKLSTGETINPTNPYLRKTYGGIGGNQIAQMYQAQTARSQAIGQALSQREADLQLPVTQNTRLYNQQQSQLGYQNTQAANVANAQQAGQQYGLIRDQQRQALGTGFNG